MTVQTIGIGGDGTLLRRVTRSDALLTALFGADLLLFAPPLAGMIGISAPIMLGIGVFCMVAGGLAFVLAGRPGLLPQVGRAALLLNLALMLALPLILVAGWLPLTALGTGAMLVLILICAGFAAVQWVGLRRLG